MFLKQNCKHFLTDRPCFFHKKHYIICENCDFFEPIGKKFLIIKLGASGDVLRTTFLLNIIKQEQNNSHISWIVSKKSKDILLNNPLIDEILVLEDLIIFQLLLKKFDVSINIDLSSESLEIATIIKSNEKRGYVLDSNNFVLPLGNDASNWFYMSMIDNIKKKNQKTYQELAANTSGYPFNGERIIVPIVEDEKKFALNFALKNNLITNSSKNPIIGLNIGSGGRWNEKRWPKKHWKNLASVLTEKGFQIILFAGPEEKEIEKELINYSKDIVSIGTENSIPRFFALITLVDVMITGDTLALHAALGLNKKVIALFGPTSSNEIEMYDLGKKLVVPYECQGCYNSVCPQGRECLEVITPEMVLENARSGQCQRYKG
ncbi:MAG: glycosyltransferase family 9 protein [Oligoflexia bacterium]|nr:glycosyltransferase family 9 protein [Oligoflexia bacterium]